MVSVIIGVDGGGTKTEVAVVAADGRLISTATSGPTNPAALPIDEVCGNLARGIRDALSPIGHIDGVKYVSVSMAGYLGGLWGSEIRRCVLEALGSLARGGVEVYLSEDIEAAHASAFLLGDGVVGILGTGSNFYGIYRGVRVRVGGWGHLIDDEGGAYHIGALGLSKVVKSYDGRISRTSLLDCALKLYGVSRVEELVEKIYSSKDVKGTVASFARCVFEEARRGDAEALAVIKGEVEEVVNALATVIRRLNAGEIPIALMGGTYMANRDVLKPLIEGELSKVLNRAVSINEPLIRQSCAASLIPMRMGLQEVPQDFLRNIVSTCSYASQA